MARSIDELVEDFEVFEDWEERYRYIVDLGKQLPAMPDSVKTDANKIPGCMSQVWMTCEETGASLTFLADSDAFIVKGLIAILLELYSGRTPNEILGIDALDVLTRLGLANHLSPNRRNGFVSIVDRIKQEAKMRT